MWPFHLTKTTEVPLKNFYIFDEKTALGKFGDTSIKTSLGSLANQFLKIVFGG